MSHREANIKEMPIRQRNSKMKCEWCVYRDKKNPEICKNCSFNETTKPRQDLEKVDILRMARILHDKEIQAWKDKIPRLSRCPECNERSLRFDSIRDYFECLNKECPLFLKPISNTSDTSELFGQIVIRLLKI